jgi:hypothetical protein
MRLAASCKEGLSPTQTFKTRMKLECNHNLEGHHDHEDATSGRYLIPVYVACQLAAA